MKNLKKFYAIKIGNNTKDKIVTTYEECKKYIEDYPAIFKECKTEREAKHYLNSLDENMINTLLLQMELQRRIKIKKQMQENLDFKIPDYILDSIIDEQYYYDICLLINLAVINERFSKEQAQIIKNEIKKKCHINSVYDRVYAVNLKSA